ncbi:MAG: CDP-alcohol phosphatidyltransferase family protein [Phycisphaeraceae bacterium]|nr:CDP-alcohol phosphatidyltransferase family protein [Phycisphaeraceae bacterium]
MRPQLPNQLTILRLLLAGMFFAMLNFYRYPAGPDWALWVAIALFIIAGITDWLDGYLARKWKQESAFGRVMDPFCDKVLVLGAFIFLTGPHFVDPEAALEGKWLTMVSGVYPWMVALILARELLVTGIRGEMEGRGFAFGANVWGKIKTVLQLVGIPVILTAMWLESFPKLPARALVRWVPDIVMYVIVIVTVASGWPYIVSALKAMKNTDHHRP